jgi:hypothetical protein
MLHGTDVQRVRTIDSWYAHGCIEVVIDNKVYRMHTDEILKLMDDATFDAKKKRVHSYLTVREFHGDTL